MLQGKKICWLLGIIMQFAIADSFSQGTLDSLSVEAISIQYPQCPDTAFEGNQGYDSIAVLVRNLSDTLFTGQIAIMYQAHDTLGNYMPVDTLIRFVGGIQYSIIANSAVNVFAIVNHNFTPNYYRTGSNVVVVWPVTMGLPIFTDSLETCVYFVPLNAINEHDETNGITIFPNPAESYLSAKLHNRKIIESVRIFDVSGRLVLAPLWNDDQKIKVNALVPGIYILEITTKEKGKVRKQFVKR